MSLSRCCRFLAAVAKELREEGKYRNPNDRLVSFSEGFGGGGEEFHLEDLGSKGREEVEGSLDRRNYNPHYQSYVHTPHET